MFGHSSSVPSNTRDIGAIWIHLVPLADAWQVQSINPSGTYNLDCKPDVPPALSLVVRYLRPRICLLCLVQCSIFPGFGKSRGKPWSLGLKSPVSSRLSKPIHWHLMIRMIFPVRNPQLKGIDEGMSKSKLCSYIYGYIIYIYIYAAARTVLSSIPTSAMIVPTGLPCSLWRKNKTTTWGVQATDWRMGGVSATPPGKSKQHEGEREREINIQ